MKILITLALLLDLVITFYFIQEVKPSSLGAYVFWSSYLSLPYLFMGYLVYKEKFYLANAMGVLIVCLLTLLVYLDILYLHPDPQAMLFIFMVPLLQGGLLFIWWIIRMIRR